MPADVRIPGPDHPITITANPSRIVVRAGGKVIADTTSALSLQESDYPPVQYVPLTDVDESVLRRTDTSTYCPYKGDASYYTVATPDGEVVDAIWFYEKPFDAVAPIAGHVAFYTDRVAVAVEDQVTA